jgi:hypothetical protein
VVITIAVIAVVTVTVVPTALPKGHGGRVTRQPHGAIAIVIVTVTVTFLLCQCWRWWRWRWRWCQPVPQRHEKAPEAVDKVGRVALCPPLPQNHLAASRDAVKEQLFLVRTDTDTDIIVVAADIAADIAADTVVVVVVADTAEFNDGPEEQKVLVAAFAELLQRRVGHGVRIARGSSGSGSRQMTVAVVVAHGNAQQVLQFGGCR